MYFAPPLKGFPLGNGCRRRGSKNSNDWATGPNKKFGDIFSHMWIQSTNVTDRRSDIGRQQRPRLRIASHGKDHGNLNPRQKKTAHSLPVRTDRTHTTSTNITIFRFVSLAYFVFSRDYASFGWVLRSVSKRPRIAGSGQSRNWPTLTKLSWDCATAHI